MNSRRVIELTLVVACHPAILTGQAAKAVEHSSTNGYTNNSLPSFQNITFFGEQASTFYRAFVATLRSTRQMLFSFFQFLLQDVPQR